MISTWIKKFIDQKLHVAKNLYEGQCDGSYAEAIIILASVISAISAEVWPGKGIDRKRFVEICVRYGQAQLEIKKISIPLLIEYLYDQGEQSGVTAIKHKFPQAFLMFPGNDSLVITGKDVDLFEDEVRQFLSIDTKTLRTFSYGNVFYKEVRSGFVHEYRYGDRSTSIPMTAAGDHAISYVNMVKRNSNRLIHFSYEWMEQLVLSVGEYFEKNTPTLPLSYPNTWWLDG